MMIIKKVLCFSLLFCSISCTNYHNTRDSACSDSIYVSVDSLKREVDSLRLQIRLYQDTVEEQRIRLEKIRTILEPLIQQEDYE